MCTGIVLSSSVDLSCYRLINGILTEWKENSFLCSWRGVLMVIGGFK